MSKPFDLEAAKAGEPVEMMLGNEWIPTHFIGTKINGSVVLEYKQTVHYISIAYSNSMLRMAAKKVTVRYRVGLFIDLHGTVWTDTANTPEKEILMAKHMDFKEWLTDWQEAEIPK